MTEHRASPVDRLAAFLVRRRYVILPVALLLLAVSFPIARQLQLDRTIESLYPPDDPLLADYQQSRRLFGGDEFAIVAYTDPKLLSEVAPWISQEATGRVQELAGNLSRINGVQSRSTQELAGLTERTRKVVGEKGGRFAFLMVPVATRSAYRQVEGVLIGVDRKTTAVVLRLTPEDELPSDRTRGETITEIREVAREFGQKHDLHVAVVGEPVQVHDMFEYVDEDGRKLFFWSLTALSAVILMLFRSLRWMLLPVLIVIMTIVWTDALLVLSGMKLSMVSSMMNSLVTIIGIATVMHLTVHYRELRSELSRVDAMRQTLRDLLPAVLWTCATTAVGFGALLSSEITPVRSFGLMMATATMMVLFAVAACLPGIAVLNSWPEQTLACLNRLLSRLFRPATIFLPGILTRNRVTILVPDPKFAPAELKLADWLSRTAGFVRRHATAVSLVMLATFVFFSLGLLRLDVETDFSRNFREKSPIVQSLNFVETKLGGAGTWEVNFPAPKELDQEYLDKVRRLTQRLRKDFVRDGEGEVTKVIAITDGFDLLDSRFAQRFFPTLQSRIDAVNDLQPEFISSLYNPSSGRMRIVLRSRERQQSSEKLKLIGEVEAVADDWAQKELQNIDEKPDAKTTGLYVLLAFLVDSLLNDQLISFLLAATGIVIMMSIAFRSITIGFLMLLPNTFPILLVVGGIGWLGIPLNIATAMIASVSMGLTVDFSIHYLAGYRRARAAGYSQDDALKVTLKNVGRALVFANLALVIGFSVLTISLFIPLVYFGVLVSVAMVAGLIGDLTFLPLILLWTDRDRRTPATQEQPVGEVETFAMEATTRNVADE